jgi:hypothetical protein
MKPRWLQQGLAVAALTAFSSFAGAAVLLDTIAGNDCSGVFGQGFANCKIPAQYDPNESPIIIKFEFNTDDNGLVTDIEDVEINSSLFPSIDGSEFSFIHTGQGTGSWTYTPGAGDPDINFFVAKGGPNFNLFSTGGLTDAYLTPTNPNNQQPFGLSHLSFYDTGGNNQIPEPGTLVLLGMAALGLAVSRRRNASS